MFLKKYVWSYDLWPLFRKLHTTEAYGLCELLLILSTLLDAEVSCLQMHSVSFSCLDTSWYLGSSCNRLKKCPKKRKKGFRLWKCHDFSCKSQKGNGRRQMSRGVISTSVPGGTARSSLASTCAALGDIRLSESWINQRYDVNWEIPIRIYKGYKYLRLVLK